MKTQTLILDALSTALQYRIDTAPPFPGLHFANHLLNNLSGLDFLYSKLADEESIAVLDWIVSYRLIESLTSKEVALKLCTPQISHESWRSMLEQARKLPEYSLKENLDVDVVENYILDGYNLSGKCGVSKDDIILDLGAFNGNSTIVLGRHAHAGKVYAFEPNPDTQAILQENLKSANVSNYELIRLGVSSEEGTVKFSRGGAGSRITEHGDVDVNITTVDAFVRTRNLEKVDFIKLDIEGFELPALKGAADTIRNFRPKLAISAYHLHYDLFEIPKLIQSLSRWYKMYLRHNANYDGEFVLFCAPMVPSW